MAKTAQEFLDQLAASDLIPPEVLESLRRQVAKASKPVSSGTVARLLVDNGHLTESQGERLSGAALPASKKSTSHSGVLGLEPIGESQAKPAKTQTKSQAEIDRAAAELGLAPIHEEPKAAATKPAAKPADGPQLKPKEKAAVVIDGLMPLAEIPPAVTKHAATKGAPSTIAKAKPAPSGSPSTIAKAKVSPAPAAPLVEGLAPLSPLPGDDLFGPASESVAGPLAAAPLIGATPAVSRPTAAPRKRSQVSPVIVVAVVLLLLVGGGAGFVLTRSNGDREFELAEQDYQAKAYDAAIAKHSAFLEDFPANSKVSTSRLHRAMAKILAASPAKDNYTAILPVAKTALGEIGGEKELTQLHAELAPLLIDMAANLTEQAQQGKTLAESTEKLAQAKDALALANDGRFVPGSLRQWQRLTDVEESLALLERDLGRTKTLEGALTAIKKHAEGGKLDGALAERTRLLASYPEAGGDLKNLGKELAKGIAAQVKTAVDSSKGETSEAKSSVLASLSLASGKPATGGETPQQTFFALAAGSVWALDGGTGKLLWSRPAGRNGGHAVMPLTADVASDVVIADLLRNEVACANSRSGSLRWRHQFKEPLAGEPRVMDGQVIVATIGGKIFALDGQSGNGKSTAQLPQGTRLGATTGSEKIFVVADHSFLYVLSPALKCEAAVYLGHDPESVEASPVILSGHVVVAENRAATSLLHVIGLGDKGLLAGPQLQAELAGVVATTPVRIGERLFVLTDQQTVAFDYQPGDEPLRKLGETPASSALPLTRFGSVLSDKLWIADDGLRRFDFNPSGGIFKEAWVGFAGETLEAPPQGIADAVFCVRRRPGNPGVIATALKATSGETLWETHLAQPFASVSVGTDGQPAWATTTSGAEVNVDLASMSGSGVQFVPVTAETKGSVPLPDASLAAPTLRWAGGRLSISTSGSVDLLDANTSLPLAEPFQLSIRPGAALANCSAAIIQGDGDNVVICDGSNSVYLLRLEKVSQPRMMLVAKATLKVPALSRVGTLEGSAYVVDAAGAVQVLTFPDLKSKLSAKLDCHAVASGPFAAGKHILLETDKGELVCLDAAGKLAWKISLTDGPLAGSPLAVSGDLLLPLRSGTLLRVAGASGKEIARAEFRQPLAGSPALLGNIVIVPTAAGGILKAAIPEKK